MNIAHSSKPTIVPILDQFLEKQQKIINQHEKNLSTIMILNATWLIGESGRMRCKNFIRSEREDCPDLHCGGLRTMEGSLTHLFIFFFNVITNTPEKTSGEKKTSLQLVRKPNTAQHPTMT